MGAVEMFFVANKNMGAVEVFFAQIYKTISHLMSIWGLLGGCVDR